MAHQQEENHFEADPSPTVYVRAVAAADVFETENGETLTVGGEPLDIDAPLYAIHDETGRRVGVFADREAAFAAARWHGAVPVSVH